MKIELIPVGPLQSNCYVVYDETGLAAVVIDPGDEPEKIYRTVREKNLKVAAIVCTHAHFDHVGAVGRLRQKTGAPVLLHVGDLEIYSRADEQGAIWGFRIEQPPKPDSFVSEGDAVTAGAVTLRVLHTPGHSPGGICLYAEAEGVVFTGDTIFAGSIGRTDFKGGDIEALKRSFRRIINLPEKTQLFPGHGNWTTVGDERETNFFMREI
ncbi:MAG: MBL fold metallo-hydrolase [Thermodesulfovibrionales bacterium]